MRRALPVPLLLLVLLAAPCAAAKERVAYGPLPPDLAAVVTDERDNTLGRMALAAIERGEGDTAGARSLLVLLGDAGLKITAERLAKGRLEPQALADLLAVAAACEHKGADVLLGRAAGEARPVLRMIAADGLGRGRTPSAVPLLARLARDPVPAVRIAALRSLFAIESPQAVAARIAVPTDSEAELLARRLRWHRRCEDVAPALRASALHAYLDERSVAVRTAAADYLTLERVDAPRPVLELIVREMGQGPFIAGAVRTVRGLPTTGYDPVTERRLAIQALMTLLSRPDPEPGDQARWIDQAVAWVARPVAMDPYRRDPIPEHVLRRRLPDLGAAIIEPVVRRLARGGFAEPRQGVILLRELGPGLALPPLRAFLTPRAETPAFESRAEAGQRRYLRNAAAGAVQELGRIGDEQLARALLTGEESKPLKIDILHALRGEEGAWVVALLGEVMQGKDSELRSHAISLLEQRPEPEARTLLVADLFERMERPHDRLRPLVERGDESAYEVLKRALEDKRSFLRKAALSQFNRRRNPRLTGEPARKLLAAHAPAAQSPQEIQDYVYALLSVDPERAVAWVRTQWADLPTQGLRMTTLRILGEAHGEAARKAAIDLALQKAAGAGVAKPMKLSAAAVITGPRDGGAFDGLGRTYRAPEVRGFWRGLLFSDDADLQREGIRAYAHAGAPPVPDRLLSLLAKAFDGKALREGDTSPEGEQAFAREVLGALHFQPWARVERAMIDAALDVHGEVNTRIYAAHLLMGKLSDAGRKRVMAWLAYTPAPKPAGGGDEPAPGVHADGILQLFLAAAIGENADAATAGTLFASLKQELFDFYTPERLMELLRGSSTGAVEQQLWSRAVPLARGIGRTKHVPSILGMLELVFDLRFALYARACANAQAEFARAAGAGAAARTPSRLIDLWHNDGGPNWGMPSALHDILYEVKNLDDEVLAAGYRRVLEKARRDGRLAQFPALFMYRVQANLLEPHTGRKPKSADVVLEFTRAMGRPDGPIHMQLHRRSASELADAGRFVEAAAAQRHVVRIIARGSHDDRELGLWVYNRAVLDALEGAAAAQRGMTPLAEAHFRRAVLRAPNDPNVLNIAAWYRATSGFALDKAEVEARRATLLEARVENRPSPNAADTLAYVLLGRGRAREGLAVLKPRMRERGAYDNGLLHYHMAEMYAATRMWRSARDALVEALVWDRYLARRAKGEARFKPLFAKQSLAAIEKLAAQKRMEADLP